MQQPAHALAAAGPGDALRQVHVRLREIGAIGAARIAVQDADEIDDHVAVARQAVERVVVVHVAGEQGDGGQDLEFSSLAVAAGGHQDLVLSTRKPGDEMTADEASAADDKDTHGAAPVLQDSGPILPCTGRIRKRAAKAPDDIPPTPGADPQLASNLP